MKLRAAIAMALFLGTAAHAGLVGISIQPLTPELAEAMGIPQEGIVVRDVVAGGPADHAGVLAGDVILELNKKKVENIENFVTATREMPAGKSISLTVWREGLGRYFIGVKLARDDRPAMGGPTPVGSEPHGRIPPPAATAPAPTHKPDWRNRPEPTPVPPTDPFPQSLPPTTAEPVPNATGNLVKDGDFEHGLVPPWGTGAINEGRPWRVLEGTRAFGESTFSPVHSGRFALSIRHLTDEREGWIGVTSQRIGALKSGGRYTLSVGVKGDKMPEGAIRVRLVVSGQRPGVAKGLTEGAGPPQLPVAEIAVPSGTFDWIRLETQFVAPGGEIDLEILSVNKVMAVLDDVSLVENP